MTKITICLNQQQGDIRNHIMNGTYIGKASYCIQLNNRLTRNVEIHILAFFTYAIYCENINFKDSRYQKSSIYNSISDVNHAYKMTF